MKFKNIKLNSIRNKLIISLVAICVIPLIIMGFFSYNQSESILDKKLTLTSTQNVEEINNGLTDYLKAFTDMNIMATNNYVFINVDEGKNDEYLFDILKGIKESNKDILSIYYGTASGKFINYPTEKSPEGYNATTRPWYKQAMESKGEIVITPPYKDSITGENVVTIAKSVEKNGEIVGVVGLDCTLSTIAERISTKKIGETGYVYIVGADGNVIAHPQKDRINTPSTIFDKIKSKDKDFLKYELNGEKRFGAYTANELTGWKIVATMQESELSNDTKSILKTNIFIIIIMTLISVGMSLLLSKGIAYNIKKLKEVYAKASNGDLTVTMTSITKDEFSDLAISFNIMMKNISELMNNVMKSSKIVLATSISLASMSEEVTASIGEVAKAIEDVSHGATDQAQNAQDGASQMDDLSNRIDGIGSTSNEMDKISSNTKDLGSKGLQMVDTLIEKSNKTKIATTEVNNIVQDMNESTKQINAISETIANITAQTNLLSLNASIESARAGEAGKGFAVVAEEIRKLAEQSKASTEEIKAIISNIQKKSDTAVNAIKSTENIVIEQEVAVGQTQEIFNEILKSIEIMITKVDEIKVSIVDVNKTKEKTMSGIEHISAISQETASASEEVTASTEEIKATMNGLTNYSNELQVLAEKLSNEISRFKTN